MFFNVREPVFAKVQHKFKYYIDVALNINTEQ